MSGLFREHGNRLGESLRTFLCEAESTINNRPLTETLSDPLSEPPLSPSMLLTGKTRLVLSPPGEFKRRLILSKEMETHAAPSTRVLVKVEQRVLATVTSKDQVDTAKKKFQGWRCGITEGKPVSEKQMAFG